MNVTISDPFVSCLVGIKLQYSGGFITGGDALESLDEIKSSFYGLVGDPPNGFGKDAKRFDERYLAVKEEIWAQHHFGESSLVPVGVQELVKYDKDA